MNITPRLMRGLLFLLPLLMVLAACSNITPFEPDGNDLKLSESGIEGQILLGPIRPVVRLDGGPNTAPMVAEVQVQDPKDDTMIQTFSSAEDGSFRVVLAPGTYKLIPQSFAQLYPRASPQEVVVEAGVFTQVTIDYDSGIR